MQGPLSEGEGIDLVEWPVSLAHWSHKHDADQVRFLVELLDLDRIAWLGIVHRAQDRGRSYEFRALQVAIAQRLEEVELILRPELLEISERVLGGSGL